MTTNSDDSHEMFIRLLTKHERVIRASIRAVIRRTEDVDEVMQAVSLVAWRRFESVTDVEGFAKWACVIARHEILKFQRTKARDRMELDEALVMTICDEGAEEVSVHSRSLTHLEGCLKRMTESQRLLVLKVYAPGCSIKAVARQMGKSPEGLYQLLRRIRLELKRCVEIQATTEGELT